MQNPFYDDNEGDTEIIDKQEDFDQNMGEAQDAFDVAFDLDGEDHTIPEQITSLGDVFTSGAEALDNYGNGFSEMLEDHFAGDGTVLGELGEAGAAIGGELVEGASEAGMAVVGGFLDFAGEIVHGVGEGAEELSKGWDHLMEGDVVAAGTDVVEGAKDIGNAVVDAVEVGAEGVVDMFAELGEAGWSVTAEVAEGVSEVGSAIGDGLSDAWDSVFGDDEDEEQDEEEAG